VNSGSDNILPNKKGACCTGLPILFMQMFAIKVKIGNSEPLL